MPTRPATSERVTVTCPRCAAQRRVSPSTADAIYYGEQSGLCRPCGARNGISGPRRAPAPTSAPIDRSWDVDAACRGMNDSPFYPPDGARGHNLWRLEQEAKQICAECPVMQQCREAGRHERHGVWGGTTPAERGYDQSGRALPRHRQPEVAA